MRHKNTKNKTTAAIDRTLRIVVASLSRPTMLASSFINLIVIDLLSSSQVTSNPASNRWASNAFIFFVRQCFFTFIHTTVVIPAHRFIDIKHDFKRTTCTLVDGTAGQVSERVMRARTFSDFVFTVCCEATAAGSARWRRFSRIRPAPIWDRRQSISPGPLD